MAPKDWRFALEWRYGGTDERMLNVGVVRNDAGTATQASVGAGINSALGVNLATAVSSDIEYMGCHVAGITTNDADLFTPTGAPLFGSITGGSGVPRNCCGLVTLNTGLAGKRGRGRIYLPPPNNNKLEIATSTWTSGHVAVMETAVQSAITDALALGDSLIWGKYTAVNQGAFTAYDDTRVVGRRNVGTQRRRINHRGG